MAQVTVSGSSFTALNKPARVNRSLKKDVLGSPLQVSVPQTRKCNKRCTRIAVSRVVDSTTTTTTTTSNQTRGFVPPGYTSVPAVIKVVRKKRVTRDEALENASDVWADLTGKKKIRFQLFSEEVDTATGTAKKSGKVVIKDWAQKARSKEDKVEYTAEFSIKFQDFGEPGAILVENEHQAEFYLDSITLQFPTGPVNFPCHSFIASTTNDPKPRVFFTNKVYKAHETPAGLKALREQELNTLRGDGTGERQVWDRVYDYQVYNDLGDSDKSPELSRPVLGGGEFIYPRRVRTGRPPSKTDPTKEQKVVKGAPVYVPRDEKFEPIKKSNFVANQLRGLAHKLMPSLRDHFRKDETPGEFDTFGDIDLLYQEGLDTAEESTRQKAARDFNQAELLAGLNAGEEETPEDARERIRALDALPIPEFLKELIRTATSPKSLLKYPLPKVLARDRFAWIRDDEFARQTLAGVNPVAISCLEEFPPRSSLPEAEYGPQESVITAEAIERFLEGMTAAEALDAKKLYIIDYHDIFMPYVNRINSLPGREIYATRALFFLNGSGALKPVAIELSLPPTDGALASNRFFTPGQDATGFWLWQLAKLHFCAVDSGYHQLISHWLRTHACTEPYIIATYRQMSALHPISKLLHPHLRYTMEINAAARQSLITADGVIESTFTPGRYSLEMSAVVYGATWRFDQEALPEDLIRRGMAVRDETAPCGVRLRIEDYPYAADGLLVFSSIEEWIRNYVSLYYTNNESILEDEELQAWWNEVRTKGHVDKKDEEWWPTLDSPESLVRILTTIIWIASGHHAAVNFGQYDFTGYVPNQPCIARKLIPEQNDPEFNRMLRDPHKFMLETLPSQEQATIVMMVVESLSTHSPDEEYLGYNGNHEFWTRDERAMKAFQDFAAQLAAVDEQIGQRNKDLANKHRTGAGVMPYELLLQKSGPGITMRGIPNSISI